MRVEAWALDLRIAARNLTRQMRRTLLALVTLVGGIVAYLIAGGFIEWIFHDMRESTIHSQLGHIQVVRPGYLREGLADPYRFMLPAGGEAEVASMDPRIVTVAPRLAFSGLASLGESTISFVGEGIDPVKEAPITRAITITHGSDLQSCPDGRCAILGEGLAANLGAQPGQSIVLLGTAADGAINAVEIVVSGIFATKTQAYDDTVLRVPVALARELMRVEGSTTWVVLLGNTPDTEAVAEALAARLPAAEYELVPWTELADFYNKTVELFSRQVGVVRLLIALIVVLSITNTLSMAVIERTNEIGTSMALGVPRRAVLRLFLWEGALLGLAGGLLGILLGLLVGQIVSAIGIPMPPPPGMARGYIGRIAIPPALVLDGFLLAFLTTLAASIFPAWKASRMNIVDALRHQR